MKNRVGEIWTSKKGENFTIIEYFGWDNCTIRFTDGTIIYNINYSNIKAKRIKNPNYRSVFNIGYIGVGNYEFDARSKCAKVWRSMLNRCYCDGFPNYIGCSVTIKWHNFQNFAKWFEENYNPAFMENWHLDKDLLVDNNKVYSPETCCFIPHKLNNFFKGNKRNTQNNIKIVANIAIEYKNKISNKVYNKLTNQIKL